MRQLLSVLATTVVLLIARTPTEGATVGFTQEFNDGNGGFTGGSESYTVFSSGGVGGVDDGFLEVGNFNFVSRLGTRTIENNFTGNLLADGVSGFSFWLSELTLDNNIEIHVGVGSAFSNFWLSMDGFDPPVNSWEMFTVDFSDEARWVQIIGTGSFQDALQTSDRLLFRHDVAPFDQLPQSIQGNFGIDRITVVPEPSSLFLLTLGSMALVRARHRKTLTSNHT